MTGKHKRVMIPIDPYIHALKHYNSREDYPECPSCHYFNTLYDIMSKDNDELMEAYVKTCREHILTEHEPEG